MSFITWYGHSAFKIEAANSSVIIDPFFAPGSNYSWRDAGHVDLVLVTHDHGDHVGNAVEICKNTGARLGAIVGTAQVLEKRGVPADQILNGIGFNIGGTLVCKGISSTMVQAFHSSDSAMPAGYIVKMPDGLTLYHAGDTGIFGSMALLGDIYNIDLALLPIGGVFTMDATQAAHACALLGCRKVIPMHWGTFPVIAQSPDEFVAKAAAIAPRCECVVMAQGQTIEVKPQGKAC